MGKLNRHVPAVTCVCVQSQNLILECVVVLVVVLMDTMFGHWHKGQEQEQVDQGSLLEGSLSAGVVVQLLAQVSMLAPEIS